MCIQSLASLSYLKLWCGSQTRLGFPVAVAVAVAVAKASSFSSDLTPSLGTSIRHLWAPRKKDKKRVACLLPMPQHLQNKKLVFLLICSGSKRGSSKVFFFFFFVFFRAAPAAYGGSHARGLIRAVAAGLHQSHSNVGSESRLQPAPQLPAMPDP